MKRELQQKSTLLKKVESLHSLRSQQEASPRILYKERDVTRGLDSIELQTEPPTDSIQKRAKFARKADAIMRKQLRNKSGLPKANRREDPPSHRSDSDPAYSPKGTQKDAGPYLQYAPNSDTQGSFASDSDSSDWVPPPPPPKKRGLQIPGLALGGLGFSTPPPGVGEPAMKAPTPPPPVEVVQPKPIVLPPKEEEKVKPPEEEEVKVVEEKEIKDSSSSVWEEEEAFYWAERGGRALYADDELHVLMLSLAFCLMLKPTRGTLDEYYCETQPHISGKTNVLFLLHEHLNHPANQWVLPSLLGKVEKLRPPLAGQRLLKLLCTRLFDPSIYREQRLLARGAYGTVYSCRTGLAEPKTVAIKILPVPNSISERCVLHDIFTEIAVLEELRLERGVSELYDYGLDSDNYYIVMREYACSLREWRL